MQPMIRCKCVQTPGSSLAIPLFQPHDVFLWHGPILSAISSNVLAVILSIAMTTGIRTTEASYNPDVVVLAAGISTPDLAAKAGVTVPLEDKPGTVNIVTAPLPPLLHHILVTGEATCLQSCTCMGGEARGDAGV